MVINKVVYYKNGMKYKAFEVKSGTNVVVPPIGVRLILDAHTLYIDNVSFFSSNDLATVALCINLTDKNPLTD